MRAVSILVGCALLACAPPSEPPEPPNIVLILSDDQGWADLGVHAVLSDVRTPNLDRLATGGVRFSRAYVTAPQCRPARAGIMTGRYQTRFGTELNSGEGLPPAEITIAERLRSAGYVTGMSGKWQLNATEHNSVDEEGRARVKWRDVCEPQLHGFDEYFCGVGSPYVVSHHLDGRAVSDPPASLENRGYRVDLATEAALSFLERHRDDRFFLFVSYHSPHVPLQSPDRYLDRFPHVTDERRKQGLAALSAMDDGVGKILDRIERYGIAERTLIFFLSDNGAPVRNYRKVNWNGSRNDPFLGGKGMLTEGGLRVPAAVYWKGKLAPGRVFDEMVSALDFAVTANAVAGLAPDPGFDGVDLLPFLVGEVQGGPHDVLYWRWGGQSAVQQGRWKLIRIGADERFLFDIESEQGEWRDRAGESPEIARELEAQLEAWLAEQQPPGFRDPFPRDFKVVNFLRDPPPRSAPLRDPPP